MKSRSKSQVLFQLVPIRFGWNIWWYPSNTWLSKLTRCVTSRFSQGKVIQWNNLYNVFLVIDLKTVYVWFSRRSFIFGVMQQMKVIMDHKQQHVSRLIALVPIRLLNNVLHYHYHYHYFFTIHPLIRLNKHNMQI